MKPMKTLTILSVIASVSLCGFNFAQAQDKPPALSATPSKDEAASCKPRGPGPGHGPKDRKDWGKDRRFRGGPDQEPGKGGFDLGRMLQLTPEQKEKVKAIMETQKPKIQAIREEERAKMKAIFDDVDKQIRPLLTPEQVAVLDNAKKLRESEATLRKSDQATAPKKDAASKEE